MTKIFLSFSRIFCGMREVEWCFSSVFCAIIYKKISVITAFPCAARQMIGLRAFFACFLRDGQQGKCRSGRIRLLTDKDENVWIQGTT